MLPWPEILRAVCETSRFELGCIVEHDGGRNAVALHVSSQDATCRHFLICVYCTSVLTSCDRSEGGPPSEFVLSSEFCTCSGMMRRGMERDNNPAFELLVGSLSAERHSQHYLVLRRRHVLANSPDDIDPSTRQVIVLLRMAWRYHRLSRQLAGEARGISDALGLIPQPFYVLDADLRLRHANAPGARLLGRGHGLKRCGERLDLDSQEQKQRLHQLVQAVADPSSAQQSRTMLLPQPIGYVPMVLNLFPLPLSIRTGLFGATATDPLVAILVRNAERGYSLCAERLKEYFGFTPAEARMAAALIDGSSVVEAARQLSISVNTARTHMKHIFEKTHTRRQTELAVLLVSTAAEGVP